MICDLRVSVTDRCNFRCFYCLPNGEPPLAHKDTILTYEEITRACEIFVSLGIKKIRLTGGEPLLRRDIENLVARLSKLKPRLKDLALTTNGHTLPDRAKDLKRLGLDRITISLDSLEPENFQKITGVHKLKNVLEAIEAAKLVDLEPIKINTVIVRGRNDSELIEFAKFARELDVSIRFIEYMPLDSGHSWKRNMVVSGKEIVEKINKVHPLILKQKSRGNETAWKYRFADSAEGEIGIIAPVTEMFCGACSRIRLTADGQIRTCLFSKTEHNLRDVLRRVSSNEEVVKFIKQATLKKEASHQINDENFIQPERTMSFIGG